jgi:NAD(P)-dependent dehydrogenase (short-subunit alcohol dehydrogenase family)
MSDKMSFEGRVAIVTGAGRGMGREYALALGARGASVLVNDVGSSVEGRGTSSEVAEETASEIRSRGGVAVADSSSVGSVEGAQDIARRAMEEFGRVDVLINNAGIMDLRPLVETDQDTLDRHLDVHVKGSVFTAQAVWPHMVERGYGRIVNTTSAGIYGYPNATAYGSAKGAVLALTRGLAVEGEPLGIKVNTISPFARTRMGTEHLPGAGETSDVAPAVLYLAHEDVAISGEILFASGGRVARICLAETVGIRSSDLTVELVRDRIEEIMDVTGARYPTSALDVMAQASAAES